MHFLYQYYNENHHQRATLRITPHSAYTHHSLGRHTPRSRSMPSGGRAGPPAFRQTFARAPSSSSELRTALRTASNQERQSPLATTALPRFSRLPFFIYLSPVDFITVCYASRGRDQRRHHLKRRLVHGLTLINFVFTFFSIQSFGGNCPLIALVLQRTSTFGCTYLRIIIIFLIVCTTARTNPGRNENFK